MCVNLYIFLDYHMYVDVGLDATANSEITFHLMVNNCSNTFNSH